MPWHTLPNRWMPCRCRLRTGTAFARSFAARMAPTRLAFMDAVVPPNCPITRCLAETVYARSQLDYLSLKYIPFKSLYVLKSNDRVDKYNAWSRM
jgi:hypothetical protein